MFTISESILGSANLKKLDEDPPWVGDIFWGQKPEIPMGFQMFFRAKACNYHRKALK
jgi:hypothetical protein